MYCKSFLLFILLFVLFCCNSNKSNQPSWGYDFKAFANTELEELAYAVQDQDIPEINRILKNKKLNIDLQEKQFGNTLLMMATIHNLDRSVEALLKHGADPNLRDFENDESAFHIACATNQYVCNTKMVSDMIRYGAFVDSTQHYKTKDYTGEREIITFPLMIAAESGCLEIIKILVRNGVDVNQYVHYEGYGAISVALKHDHLDIVKYLLIDCKAKIPEVCYISKHDGSAEEKFTIEDMLNRESFEPGSDNYRLKEEILRFLKEKE